MNSDDDIVTRLRFVAQIHEGRVKHECIAEAADEIERLREAGNRIAMHLDAHYGTGNPIGLSTKRALAEWKEVRRG